jgi:hypothetical protein
MELDRMTNIPEQDDATVIDGSGAIRAIEALNRLAAATSVRLPTKPDVPAAPDVVVHNLPRVTLSREEAAAALGIGLDSFERHVQPDLRMVRRGRLRLVPIVELERWATEASERTVP